ncbi:MAG: hypothetical protein H0X37_12800 [Herpetosiphonaceae bacterium]|nr:hypothetical protein [Herpetosiphonaceae bacterium]
MRRLLPSVLLLFLLIFLIPIYQVQQTSEVLILSVSLLAIGVFLAFGNQPRGLELLGGITVLMSFVGIYFAGHIMGNNGGLCLLTLWALALVGVAALMWRRATFVERGQIMVVNQLPDNRIIIFGEGVHRPLTPSFERLLAVLPAYELIQEIELHRVNTESLFNVDKIEVLIRYRVNSAREVVVGFPNRERAFEELQHERGHPESNGDYVGFWTEMMRRQMAHEVDEATRSLIASISGPTDVSKGRSDHARKIRVRLQESVQRWGVDIMELRLLEVVVDPERIRAANRDRIIARELQDAERKATIDAQVVEKVGAAQAKATAQMVSEIVGSLKEQGADLAPEDLERIIITAMQRMTDTQQLSGFFRQVTQAQAGGAPPGPPTGGSGPR